MDKPVLARLQKVMQLREEVESLAVGGHFHPDVDWSESGTHLTLRADLPGCLPEQLKLEQDDDAVTLSGERADLPPTEDALHRERRTGSFSRRIPFPLPVKVPSGEAKLVAGVLSVRFEKLHKTIDVGAEEESRT